MPVIERVRPGNSVVLESRYERVAVRRASLGYVFAGTCCIRRPVRRLGLFPAVLSSAGLRLNPRKALGEAVVEAYVLIQTEIGKPPQVAAELGFIPGVGTADILAGPYDVIVRVEAADVDALGKLVVTKIQAVEGVIRTLTCPVVHL